MRGKSTEDFRTRQGHRDSFMSLAIALPRDRSIQVHSSTMVHEVNCDACRRDTIFRRTVRISNRWSCWVRLTPAYLSQTPGIRSTIGNSNKGIGFSSTPVWADLT